MARERFNKQLIYKEVLKVVNKEYSIDCVHIFLYVVHHVDECTYFVFPFYNVDVYQNVYAPQFHPLPDHLLWYEYTKHSVEEDPLR